MPSYNVEFKRLKNELDVAIDAYRDSEVCSSIKDVCLNAYKLGQAIRGHCAAEYDVILSYKTIPKQQIPYMFMAIEEYKKAINRTDINLKIQLDAIENLSRAAYNLYLIRDFYMRS
jgi:hypothetical protein